MQQSNNLSIRTTSFAIDIIAFTKSITPTVYNKPLITQLVRSSTSIGANYHESTEAQTRNDFIHKISICKKEARETLYWLDVIQKTNPGLKTEVLVDEVSQLIRIFAASMRTAKQNA
ncbi:four helix bundle protein [Candidatus Woesebacteria bacterium]|nr:four helix bundle protein [Candidatus Woesebacteria bacterium]